MTDQTYPPKRPNMAHFVAPSDVKKPREGKAQLGELVDDYRDRYVLASKPRAAKNPAP